MTVSATDDYRGPSQIAYVAFPGKGRAYHAEFEGRKVQVSFSEKGKRMRVFVDNVEFVKEGQK